MVHDRRRNGGRGGGEQVRRTKGRGPEGYNEICNNNSTEAKSEASVSVNEEVTEGDTEPGVKEPKE